MKRCALFLLALPACAPDVGEKAVDSLKAREFLSASGPSHEQTIFRSEFEMTEEAAGVHVGLSGEDQTGHPRLQSEELFDTDGTVVNDTAARIFQRIEEEERN